MSVRVPLLRSKTIRAFPRHDDGARVQYVPLVTVLTAPFPTDAHFAAYACPEIGRRLDGSILSSAPTVSVAMVAAVFDVDAPGHLATPEWLASECVKLTALLAKHPGGFIYETRGGYRIVYLLPEPFGLRSREDAARWCRVYVEWCAYLGRRFAIEADVSCCDWTRLYRAPRATRSPEAGPERRGAIGNPRAIGTWAPRVTRADTERAETLKPNRAPSLRQPSRTQGHRSQRREHPHRYYPHVNYSLVQVLFREAELLGEPLGDGRWLARCPWVARHTDGRGGGEDDSCVILAPVDGRYGAWVCRHSHCARRTYRDVLLALPERAVRHAYWAFDYQLPPWLGHAWKRRRAERRAARERGAA